MASVKKMLFEIRGECNRIRPGVPATLIDTFVNARIREVMGLRTYWTDLIVRGVISVPNAYTTGTVSVTRDSAIVTGTGTNWPVSDVVNTTIRDGIFETGNQRVVPSLMQGIREDSVLLIDAAGTQEVVYVNRVEVNAFWAVFSQPHNQDCTVTMSSLANRQFRMGYESPVLDVVAIVDPQTAIINLPWGNNALSDQQYQMPQMYYPIASNIRKFNWVVDRQQGIPIMTNINLENVNMQDPQRTAGGDPEVLADLGTKTGNGIALFELWPTQLVSRQIDFSVYVDWPELVNDTDRMPWFWDPDVIKLGVLADMYRFKTGPTDWAHNLVLAREYEGRFKGAIEQLINADESKMQQDVTAPSPLGLGGGPGTLYYQSHTGSSWGADWATEL